MRTFNVFTLSKPMSVELFQLHGLLSGMCPPTTLFQPVGGSHTPRLLPSTCATWSKLKANCWPSSKCLQLVISSFWGVVRRCCSILLPIPGSTCHTAGKTFLSTCATVLWVMRQAEPAELPSGCIFVCCVGSPFRGRFSL